MRPGARLGVVLDAERRAGRSARSRNCCRRTATRGSRGRCWACPSRSTAKPWFMLVISTAPSASRLTGWLAPRWPWNIFDVFPPTASASSWWPRQMPNSGFFGLQHLADHRNRIFAGRGGVARAVGQEEAVGLVRHDLLEARARGHHRHPRPGLDQVAEDVALGAIIDRDDVGALARSFSARSHTPAPSAHLPPLHASTCRRLTSLARSMPSSPGQSAAMRLQRLEVELAVGAMRDGDGRRPFAAHQPGQRARVHPGDPDPAPFAPSTRRSCALGAVIARPGHHLAHDRAQRMGLARFDVLVIGADIADVREGEGDDLLGVGGVGHHLLVSGHRGVEAQFADRFAFARRSPGPRPRARRRTPRTAVAPFGLGRGQMGVESAMAGGAFRVAVSTMSLRDCR